MLQQLLSVFLESKCLFCDRRAYPMVNSTSGASICQYCWAKLSSCEFKKSDRTLWWRSLSTFAWGKYDGQLKRAIAQMKYNNHPEIAIVLGKLLAEAWLESDLIKYSKLSVIPIPLHRHKKKERGFNQAEKIAQGFCQSTGYALSSQALIRVKDTQPMFDLNPEARIKNLESAFNLGRKLPQHPVLLLDDIYTMGTTVKESARVLRQHNIKVIGSIVAAKTSSSRN